MYEYELRTNTYMRHTHTHTHICLSLRMSSLHCIVLLLQKALREREKIRKT